MKILKILTIVSIVAPLLSGCDKENPKEQYFGPFNSINAGSSAQAFVRNVKDTLRVVGQINTQTVIGGKEFDLDNDGTNDVGIRYAGGGGTSAWGMSSYVRPNDSVEIVVMTCKGINDKEFLTPTIIEQDSPIYADLNFMAYDGYGDGFEMTYKGHAGESNCWGNSDPKFIAVKIKKSGSVVFAWIKMSITVNDNDTQIIVDSFGSRE